MTTQAISPDLHTGTFGGNKDTRYTIEISGQYLNNVITINPQNNSGLVTVRGALIKNIGFEDIENGTIDLTVERTLKISGYPIRALEFSSSETNAFTVWIKQYNPLGAPRS